MSQQPDKLFKTKLQHYQRPAPADAWGRIESGLSKKNNKWLWLKIAASLILIAVVSAAIISVINDDSANEITATKESADTLSPESKIDSTTNTPGEPDEVASSETTEREDNVRPEITKSKVTITESDKQHETETLTEDDFEQNELMGMQEQPEEKNLSSVEAETVVVHDTTVKTFKLVIEADEVNEKYLTKRTVAQATSEEDSSSGIKKLLDKANDLKHNQDPFGDLRHMKDEILALNFQTNKKQEQNK
jgi:hypothetical protein